MRKAAVEGGRSRASERRGRSSARTRAKGAPGPMIRTEVRMPAATRNAMTTRALSRLSFFAIKG